MSPEKRAFPAVLRLDPGGAEWLDATDPERPLYGTAPAGGGRPADLAAAALKAIERSGGRARPCVLALSDAFVDQRFHHLPRLARRDLRSVLERKAAKALDVEPDEVVFSSLLVDDRGLASDTPDADQQTWLLSTARRSVLTDLLLRLRERRVPVRLVLGARSAALNRALPEDSRADDVSIAVTVGPSATTVALLVGSRLVTQYRLEGDFLTSPALGASVLQDVRNCAGFWRKRSRGGDVQRVVVTGLSDVHGGPLAASVKEALGDVEVVWRTAHSDHPSAGRIELLACCLRPGPLHADLTLRVAPSRGKVGLALSGAALAALGLAGVVRLQVGGSVDRLRGEASALVRTARELRPSEDSLVTRERARLVELRLQRAASVASAGVPVGLLEGVARAFEGRAELLSVDVGRAPEGSEPDDPGGSGDLRRRVSITGTATSDPVLVVRTLRELAARIEHSTGLRDLVVRPASLVPEPTEEGERPPLAFSIEARLEEARP
jgi:hypothetical protein